MIDPFEGCAPANRKMKIKRSARRKLSLIVERKIMALFRPLFSNKVYTVRRGLAKGLKRKGGFAFIPEKVVSPTSEEKFLVGLELKNKTVYDIGGYQGVFTIFFARSVGDRGKVVAYEPNPDNFRRLVHNVELNDFDNIEVRQLGLGKSRDRLELIYCHEDPGRSSFYEDYFKNRNFKEETIKVEVDIDSLDSQLDTCALPIPDFAGMKETMRRYKPQLFIEIHGGFENIQNVVGLLHRYEYSVFYVEKNLTIDASSINFIEDGDHLFCV